VQTQTGASLELPPGAESERVVANLGPGNAKDVLASLLNGSKFNYVILGKPDNSGGVQKVILMAKSASLGRAAPGQPAAVRPAPVQPAAVRPAPVQPAPEQADDQQQATDTPDSATAEETPEVPTSEELMQRSQKMQERLQQARQARQAGDQDKPLQPSNPNLGGPALPGQPAAVLPPTSQPTQTPPQ